MTQIGKGLPCKCEDLGADSQPLYKKPGTSPCPAIPLAERGGFWRLASQLVWLQV